MKDNETKPKESFENFTPFFFFLFVFVVASLQCDAFAFCDYCLRQVTCLTCLAYGLNALIAVIIALITMG